MQNLETARRHGLKRYRGRPCPHCASRVRYVSNHACCFCVDVVRTKAAETERKRRYRARLARVRTWEASPLGELLLALLCDLPTGSRRDG